jgi:hypothetical protein
MYKQAQSQKAIIKGSDRHEKLSLNSINHQLLLIDLIGNQHMSITQNKGLGGPRGYNFVQLFG